MTERRKLSLVTRGLDAAATLQAYVPGILVSLIITVVATFLPEHYRGPVIMSTGGVGPSFMISRLEANSMPVTHRPSYERK